MMSSGRSECLSMAEVPASFHSSALARHFLFCVYCSPQFNGLEHMVYSMVYAESICWPSRQNLASGWLMVVACLLSTSQLERVSSRRRLTCSCCSRPIYSIVRIRFIHWLASSGLLRENIIFARAVFYCGLAMRAVSANPI